MDPSQDPTPKGQQPNFRLGYTSPAKLKKGYTFHGCLHKSP